jgi:plasmid stabilization system protein ParE
MRVRFTHAARRDLVEILAYTERQYPEVYDVLRLHLRETLQRISEWPESSPRIDGYPDVRAATLGRYPYRIFFRIGREIIDVLHVRHAARQMPPDLRDTNA